MRESNPYYGYIKITFGNYSIDNVHNGNVSIQATYTSEQSCVFIIEVYDDTAHEVAEAMLRYGNGADVEYGYSEGIDANGTYTQGAHRKGQRCVIKSIHTELVGQGETMTLELIPELLEEALADAEKMRSEKCKFVGTPSQVVEEVCDLLGWNKGNIVETAELSGGNNGNDLVSDAKSYYYWDATMPVDAFLQSLTETAESKDGKRDYILDIDYGQHIGDIT